MSVIQLDRVVVLKSEGAAGWTNQNNLNRLFISVYNAGRKDTLLDYENADHFTFL